MEKSKPVTPDASQNPVVQKKKGNPEKSKIFKKYMQKAHKEWGSHPENPHNAIRM